MDTEPQRRPRPGFGRGRGANTRGERGGGGGPRRGRGQRRSISGADHAKGATEQHPKQTDSTGQTDAAALANGASPAVVSGASKDLSREPGEDVEAEVCFICASPVVHNSIAPCNHRTCHICALRLRALYKTNACAHCRSAAEYVIFTDDPEKRYEDWKDSEFARTESNLGIKYEKNEIFEDTVLLLRYNCPDPSCDVACYGWPDLHRHVKSVHHKVMCDLCTRHKKVFTHEHELFTPASLRKHERTGDDSPGAADQSGFKGHPECGFCRQRFYGDDELYAHCRDRHERCHICDRLASTDHPRGQQYYLDYNALEVHFSKDHFMCPDRECLEKKFVVFESEMDLKAHQLEAHPHGLTKDARRDARRVDMSGFDYRSPHAQNQPHQGGRREGRGRGRGRDPNADAPLPVSSAQPMRRDELAYQRQLAIHSARGVAPRTFGGQLTSSGQAVAARPPPSTQAPETISAPRQGGRNRAENDGNQILPPTAPQPQEESSSDSLPTAIPANATPAERARYQRHASITERVANLSSPDPNKLATFRSYVSSFKNGSIAAPALVEALFNLFEAPTSEVGTLIKELAEIFEITGKRDDLLKAWNDWRAMNEGYPSLPGSGGSSTSLTAASGRRILKLKSSTAQSSRSVEGHQRGGWNSPAAGLGGASLAHRLAAGASDPFPPMPSATGSRAPSSKPMPWGVRGAQRPTTGSAAASTPIASRSSSRAPAPQNAPANSSDAFPSLPAAAKPGMSANRPAGWTGALTRRDGSGTSTPVSAWGSGFAAPAATGLTEGGADDESGAGKKGKGKKKQTLIHWG